MDDTAGTVRLRNATESSKTVTQANLNCTNLRIQPQLLILNLRG